MDFVLLIPEPKGYKSLGETCLYILRDDLAVIPDNYIHPCIYQSHSKFISFFPNELIESSFRQQQQK